MKISFLLLLLLFALRCPGQNSCQNHLGVGNKVYAGLKRPTTSILATIEPSDKGYGLMTNFIVCDPIGIYLATLKGDYWMAGMNHNIPHWKFVAGVSYNIQILPSIGSFLLLGASYHNFWGNIPDEAQRAVMRQLYTDYNPLKHISGEIGIGIVIARFFTTDCRVDPFRGEVDVDLGFSF